MAGVYQGLLGAVERNAVADRIQEGQIMGARQRAGELLAEGDQQGALSRLYGSGDLQAGMGLQSVMADQQAAAREQQTARDDRLREIGTSIAPVLLRISQEEDPARRQEMLAAATQAQIMQNPDLEGDIIDRASQLAVVADSDPDSLATYARSLGAEEQERDIYSIQGSLVDATNPDSPDVLYSAPKEEELTNFQENLQAGGIDPQSPEGVALARRYAERLASGETALGSGLSDLASAIAGPAERETTRDTARSDVAEAQDELVRMLSTVGTIAEAPTGAFGARGRVSQQASAFAEQVFGVGAGQAVAALASGGATQEELSRLRAETVQVMSANIPEITAEDSGRFTDAERALTGRLTSAMDEVPDQSRTQLMESMASLVPLKVASLNRNQFLAAGQPAVEYVSADGSLNDENINILGNRLLEAGFTEEQIDRAISQVIEISSQQWVVLRPYIRQGGQ
jgi:hypothetical protein